MREQEEFGHLASFTCQLSATDAKNSIQLIILCRNMNKFLDGK